MPSILFYAHAYAGHGRNAGAETTAHDILRGLKEDGFEVDVILSQGDHDYWLDGIHVRTESSRKEINTLVQHYDILMSHLECSKRLALLAKIAKKPMVHIVHNSYKLTRGYLQIKCDLAIYNTFWVEEAHVTNAAHELYAVVADRNGIDFVIPDQTEWPGFVYHPPVDPSQYYTDIYRGEYITQVNFFHNKGPEIFFELARRFPQHKFLAVKGGYGQQEIPEILPHNVTLWENQPDMRRVYGVSRLILMPSQYESYGRIAVEAAASSVPSLVTATPGLKEAMGEAAVYVENRDDIDEWEAKLKDFIVKPNYWVEYSLKAKERSRELYNQTIWERQEVTALLTQLAAGGSIQ
jgi:glycosyltransferase involved in cell wall biosynthesis